MLNGIPKVLTGDLLKILCDMGHGDELVIADANFPAEELARRLVRIPGNDSVAVLSAISKLFPIDTYCEYPAAVMALTESDVEKGMARPSIWGDYQSFVHAPMEEIERFAFYERARKAYAIIQTGEERQYGNLILVKGVVLGGSMF